MKTSSLLGLLVSSIFSQPRRGIMHQSTLRSSGKRKPARSHRNYELRYHPANRNIGARELRQIDA